VGTPPRTRVRDTGSDQSCPRGNAARQHVDGERRERNSDVPQLVGRRDHVRLPGARAERQTAGAISARRFAPPRSRTKLARHRCGPRC
jgi:hypothetical protein